MLFSKQEIFIRNTVRYLQKKIEESIFGHYLTELIWRNRHLYKKAWAEGYLGSTEHPHRAQIVEAVTAFSPEVDSVLEVGCASGANLIRLREHFPHARLLGIDINPQAIKIAKEFFLKKNDSNIKLQVGKAYRLEVIPDASCDVVVADAILMFIPPRKIKKVLIEMLRIARRGLVLNEYVFSANGNKKCYFQGGRWAHDLPALIKDARPEAILSICQSTFTGGLWDTFGRFIVVRW